MVSVWLGIGDGLEARIGVLVAATDAALGVGKVGVVVTIAHATTLIAPRRNAAHLNMDRK